MSETIPMALTFDDVLLAPAKSEVLPSKVDIATRITREIRLNTPLVSAAMDTVTESALAIALAQEGGIGIVHKNLSIEDQAEEVDKVKRSESGIFEEIPVLVVACLKGLRASFPPMLASSYFGSIYPSVQNLLLAARAAGLGAALITLPLWSTFAARRILGCPFNVMPCAVIPLGWPRGRYGPTTRKPVEEVVSVDRYGNRAWRGN